MKAQLANILLWGNALLAAQAATGLLAAAAVHASWGHTVMAVYSEHHLGHITAAYASMSLLERVREGTTEDIAYVIYQYYLEPPSRATLDNLHKEFRCCGINGYTDWTQAAVGIAPRNTTLVSLPRSCCVEATTDGACFKFSDIGCRAAVLDYFNTCITSVMLSTAFVAMWLILLAAASWRLRKTLVERKLTVEHSQGSLLPRSGEHR